MKLTRQEKRKAKAKITEAITREIQKHGSIQLGDYYEKALPVEIQAQTLWGTSGYFVNEVKEALYIAGYQVHSVRRGGTTVTGNVPLPTKPEEKYLIATGNHVIEPGLFPKQYNEFRITGEGAMTLPEVFNAIGLCESYKPVFIKKMPKMFAALKETYKIMRGTIEKEGKQFYSYIRITNSGEAFLYIP